MGEDVHATFPISAADLPRHTSGLARYLIGKLLVRDVERGGSPAKKAILRIVETEAYPPGDEAAHHYRRMTLRNKSLFLPCGYAYVYRAYGVCWMLNVASETEGVGAGVLIRAGVPEEGLAFMLARRGSVPVRDVARGPGRLAQAMDIDRSLDGIDLCRPGPLMLADDGREPGPIGVSVRIGITRAVDSPYRFFLRDSRFVSGPAWLNRSDLAETGADGSRAAGNGVY